MHDCKDEDTRRLEAVENAEGKTVHKTATNIVFYDRSGIRVRDDVVDGCEDFKGEFVAKAGFEKLIVVDG